MEIDYDRFNLWYIQPLRFLESMPHGQGGFVALATACFLFERYAIATLIATGEKSDRSGILRIIELDFHVNNATAEAFWDVIRDGLLHQGMPLQMKYGKPLPRFAFHHLYPTISLEEINGEKWLKVQPWKFMDKVLNLWELNFELLQKSGSFPWANIGLVPM